MLGYLTILSVLAVGVLGRPELYIRCHDGERFDDVTMRCVSELIRFDEARARPNCPFNQTIAIVIPHESDCDKFYYCVNGILTVINCPVGTEFDSASGTCNWPTEGGCYSKTTTTEATTVTDSTTTTAVTTVEPTTEDDCNTTVFVTSTPSPNITTTAAPEKPICPQNTTSISIIPSPTECNKFYVCVGGQGTEYTCEAGNEFDPTVQNCVPISSEGCYAGQVATTLEPTTPEPTTPEPTTPEPTTPEPTTPEPTTPEPTTTEPTTLEPTTPEPTTPEPTTPEPTTTEPTTPEPTTPEPTTPEPTTPELTTPEPTTQTLTTLPPPICPQNTTSVSIVPSPSDCDKFYVCLAGTGTEYTCTTGTEFDPAAKDCIPISPSGCYASQAATTPEPTTPEPTTPVPTTEEPTTLAPTTEEPTTPAPTTEQPTTPEPTTQVPTTEPPPICPQNTTSISFVPSPESCDKFYICIAGSGTEYTCELGKEFDPASKDCVPISPGGCFASQMTTTPQPTTPDQTTTEATTPLPATDEPSTPEPTTEEPSTPAPTTEEPTTPVPTTEEPTTPEPTTQVPTTLPPPICPQNTTSISFVPSPEGCDKFYICVAGSGTEYTCESGKEFDPASKDCVPISSGGCFASQMTTTERPTTEEPTTPEPTTPEPTTLPSTTVPPPICPQNTTSISFVPSPAGCDKFYICVAGSGAEYTCESGKEFDLASKDCVPISSEGCFANQDKVTSTPSSNMTTPNASTPLPTISTSGTDSPCESFCQSTTAYWADSEDCRNFWSCKNGLPVQGSCVSGLKFDSIIRQCTYSVLANCAPKTNKLIIA